MGKETPIGGQRTSRSLQHPKCRSFYCMGPTGNACTPALLMALKKTIWIHLRSDARRARKTSPSARRGGTGRKPVDDSPARSRADSSNCAHGSAAQFIHEYCSRIIALDQKLHFPIDQIFERAVSRNRPVFKGMASRFILHHRPGDCFLFLSKITSFAVFRN